MPVANPPYALSPVSFRFPALASLAGRAPLGGQREIALALYLVARLAHDVLAERGVPAAMRAERATGARAWLASINISAPIRPALQSVIEATAANPAAVAKAVRSVMAVTANSLDKAARLELDRLAAKLESQPLAV